MFKASLAQRGPRRHVGPQRWYVGCGIPSGFARRANTRGGRVTEVARAKPGAPVAVDVLTKWGGGILFQGIFLHIEKIVALKAVEHKRVGFPL